MHPLLARQLDRLGLSPYTPPDGAQWTRLIDRIDAAYAQADQAREMVERSMTLSSREMQDLHTGRVRFLSVSGEPVFDADGVFTGYRGSVKDITVLKQAEEDARTAREVLATLLDAVPAPIFVKDTEHRYLLVNDASCRFFGRTREGILGRSDHDCFPKEQSDHFRAMDDEAFATGTDLVTEEPLTTTDGVTRTLSTKKRIVRVLDGREVLIGVIRDITSLEEQQRQLPEAKEAAEAGSRAKSSRSTSSSRTAWTTPSTCCADAPPRRGSRSRCRSPTTCRRRCGAIRRGCARSS